MPDDDEETGAPPYERRLSARSAGDLGVIQFQVGAMQTSIDRLERTVEKGVDQINRRLDDFDKRMAQMERRQEYDAARLKSLEEFRQEQDRRDEEKRTAQETELRAAMDGSTAAKTYRLLTAAAVGLLGVAGTVISIVAATGGFK